MHTKYMCQKLLICILSVSSVNLKGVDDTLEYIVDDSYGILSSVKAIKTQNLTCKLSINVQNPNFQRRKTFSYVCACVFSQAQKYSIISNDSLFNLWPLQAFTSIINHKQFSLRGKIGATCKNNRISASTSSREYSY